MHEWLVLPDLGAFAPGLYFAAGALAVTLVQSAIVACKILWAEWRAARRQEFPPDDPTRIWAELNASEEDAGLPLTRPPDPGFVGLAHGWAAGSDLDDVIADEDMSGGDFVRNIKQLIDLLRQLALVAPAAPTRSAAAAAADALFRGVVAASSTVST